MYFKHGIMISQYWSTPTLSINLLIHGAGVAPKYSNRIQSEKTPIYTPTNISQIYLVSPTGKVSS